MEGNRWTPASLKIGYGGLHQESCTPSLMHDAKKVGHSPQ